MAESAKNPQELAPKAKRPSGDLSASGVNWVVG